MKGGGQDPYIAEKSIIRPTFSYLGNFTISDTVFRQIIQMLVKKEKDIVKISKIRIDKYGEGMSIYMQSIVKYGCNIEECYKKFQNKVKKEIERLTSMNVQKIEILVKSIIMDETNN